MALNPVEQSYWESYLRTLPEGERPNDAVVSAGYAGNPELTDELLALYFAGKKTAGSSLLEDFQSAGDSLPQVGNHWIYLNRRGEPCCILKTERIVMHKFKDVPPEIAAAEGEGDGSLEYWRRVHREIYTPFLAKWGVHELNEATVITEFFRIVYRSPNP